MGCVPLGEAPGASGAASAARKYPKGQERMATAAEVVLMRQGHAEAVKTLFTEALRPEYIMLSTKDPAKVEGLSALKVLECTVSDVKHVLRGKYPAPQKRRRQSMGKTGQVQTYTAATRFYKTRTNFLNASGKMATESCMAGAWLCGVPDSANVGREPTACWWLDRSRWNKTVGGRRGILRAIRALWMKLRLPVRAGTEVFGGEIVEEPTRSHVAFINLKVRGGSGGGGGSAARGGEGRSC